jgi:hypothetical protein
MHPMTEYDPSSRWGSAKAIQLDGSATARKARTARADQELDLLALKEALHRKW